MISKHELKAHLSTLDFTTLPRVDQDIIETMDFVTDGFTDFSNTDGDKDMESFIESIIEIVTRAEKAAAPKMDPDPQKHGIPPAKIKQMAASFVRWYGPDRLAREQTVTATQVHDFLSKRYFSEYAIIKGDGGERYWDAFMVEMWNTVKEYAKPASFPSGDPVADIEKIKREINPKAEQPKKEPKPKKEKPAKVNLNDFLKQYMNQFPSGHFWSINYKTIDELIIANEDPIESFARKKGITLTKEQVRKVATLASKQQWKQKVAYDKRHPGGKEVEKVSPEVRFIKRYLSLDGKRVNAEYVLRFIKSLQKSIRLREIRKESPYGEIIMHLQKELIRIWHKNKTSEATFILEFEPEDRKKIAEYEKITTSEWPMKSIALLRQFITLEGRTAVKEKAKTLYKRFSDYMKANGADEYYSEIRDAIAALDSYIKGSTDRLTINEQTLNGLCSKGIGGCGKFKAMKKKSAHLSGIEQLIPITDEVQTAPSAPMTEDTIDFASIEPKEINEQTESETINAMSPIPVIPTAERLPDGIKTAREVSSMQFTKLGLIGRWRDLFGDVVEPFAAMIWSKPGKGKSTLAIEFSLMLARVFNRKVLYVASEEGFRATLAEKFRRLGGESDLVYITESLPRDLSPYQYVILDSITDMSLEYEQLNALREQFPAVTFIYIAQATIDGNYRGKKDIEHLVDVSIYINDAKIAQAQKARFGGKGSIEVFPAWMTGISRFTTLSDAISHRMQNSGAGIILEGDEGMYWLCPTAIAQDLSTKGYVIASI